MVRKLLDNLRTSYWFLPAALTGMFMVLAWVAIWLDRRKFAFPESIRAIVFAHSEEGARSLLETLAGSMITVAGVVFSITTVVLALAASQYGSRIVRNYMRDRRNQLSLAMFVGTFVYCLLVLRAVGSGDERSFVPDIGISIAILLAIVSVGVLIYFIHHMTRYIQAEHILAAISRELHGGVLKQFPDIVAGIIDHDDHRVGPPAGFDENARPVLAPESGYVQMIQFDSIVRLAERHDLFVQCQVRAGDFVIAGHTIAKVMSSGTSDHDFRRQVERSFIIDDYRTYLQDFDFAVQQFVIIFVRALSPAINDPFTAMSSLDRIGQALALFGTRRPPVCQYRDKDGKVRLITPPTSFTSLTDTALTPVRITAQGNAVVLRHFLRTIARISQDLDNPEMLTALRHQTVAAMRENRGRIGSEWEDLELKRAFQRTMKTLNRAA